MTKKYNKTIITITAWTDNEDLENVDGFNVQQNVKGDPQVAMNSLASVLSKIIYDTIEEDSYDEALNRFTQSVKAMIEVNKEG